MKEQRKVVRATGWARGCGEKSGRREERREAGLVSAPYLEGGESVLN